MIQITSIKSGYRLRVKQGNKRSEFFLISESEADSFIGEFFTIMKVKQKKKHDQLFKKFIPAGSGSGT